MTEINKKKFRFSPLLFIVEVGILLLLAQSIIAKSGNNTSREITSSTVKDKERIDSDNQDEANDEDEEYEAEYDEDDTDKQINELDDKDEEEKEEEYEDDEGAAEGEPEDDGEIEENEETEFDTIKDLNETSRENSRFFRLRKKRRRRRRCRMRRCRRRRRPRRGRRRRPSHPSAVPPAHMRPPSGGFNPSRLRPSLSSEEENNPTQERHGKLINYGRPIGPFYSATNKIPLPETPVILAVYPKNKIIPSSRATIFQPNQPRSVEYGKAKEVTISTIPTTTSKPYIAPREVPSVQIPFSPQVSPNLQQTFNIALPAQPSYVPAPAPAPIIIQSPPPAQIPDNNIKMPSSSTTFSVNAYVNGIPVNSNTKFQPSTGITSVGNSNPYQTYAMPKTSSSNCASASLEKIPVPTWTSYIQNSKGSHYYGRSVDNPTKSYCQYGNSNDAKVSTTNYQQLATPWVPAPSPVVQIQKQANSPSMTTSTITIQFPTPPPAITRYFPTIPPSSSSAYSITPSQAYEVPQNLYQAFGQQYQGQQALLNAYAPAMNQIPNNYNQNTQANAYSQNYQYKRQPNFNNFLSPAPYQGLNPPKEVYNYRTYKNNQLSTLDYEFPINNNYLDDYYYDDDNEHEDIVKAKPISYNNGQKKKPRYKKRKKKPVKKYQKKPPISKPIKPEQIVPGLLNAVKTDLERKPVNVFGKLLPEFKVTQTKKGKNFEFTIGK